MPIISQQTQKLDVMTHTYNLTHRRQEQDSAVEASLDRTAKFQASLT